MTISLALKWHKENGGESRTVKSQRDGGSNAGFTSGQGVHLNKGIEKQNGIKKLT